MSVPELADTGPGRSRTPRPIVRPPVSEVHWDEASERECRTLLRRIKAMDQLGCPFCTAPLDWLSTPGAEHVCPRCHRVFSDKVGTIFEYSKLPLSAWFAAIGRLTDAEGCTSVGLGKALSITQTSAWFLLNTLKSAALSESFRLGAKRAGLGVAETGMPSRPQIDAAIQGRPAHLPMDFGSALNGYIRTLPQDLRKPERRADRGARRRAR